MRRYEWLLAVVWLAAAPLASCEQSPASAPVQRSATSREDRLAGYLFDVPVPVSNYAFAKRVSYMFPRPWEENASPEDRERYIWQALILHYEGFRRGIAVSEQALESRINDVLKSQQQTFTRSQNHDAYARWVKDTLDEDVELFENQMRYLLQIDKLKDEVRQSAVVTVTEEEVRQEFLNERHHVGGEMVVLDSKEQAQALYERVKDPTQWDQMKASGEPQVRPVALMTLEAYVDLWSIPKEQIYAFHAMDVGSVGPPMPFGKQWCVYRLLEKRTADLKDFPNEQKAYEDQLKAKKLSEAMKRWVDDLVASAHLKILPLESL